MTDTIVAISSPPGASARGVIRLSGPGAFAITDELVKGRAEYRPDDRSHSNILKNVGMSCSRRITALVALPADTDVSAMLYVFRARHSYTRESLVELHVQGSPGFGGLLIVALL